MKIRALFSLPLALILTMSATIAWAQDAAAVQAQNISPQQLVTQATADVIAVAKREGAALKANPEKYFDEFSGLLDSVVDFTYIAKHVMGKQYYLAATEAQRAEFAGVFKKDLIKTYTGALATYVDRSFEVLPSDKPLPATGRVNVVQQVSGPDGKLKVAYTMQRRSADEPWRMVNFTLPGQGVNLGAVSRKQFALAAQTYKNDINKVIAHWGE